MRLIFTFGLFLLSFLQGFSQQVIKYQENFNAGATGWKFRNVSPHDWKWYLTEGEAASGGLRMKLPNDSNYIASPKVNLSAGKTYTVSFKARMTQGLSTRKVSVAYNTSQYRTGATNFYSTYLPINGYGEPLFLAYNPTFTVPTTGDYNIILYFEENGYAYTYFDDFIIEETFYPTVGLSFPTNLSSFNEGTDLNLQATAADQDGTVSKVEFFANGKKLAEDLAAPYEFLWKDILPGDYQITVKATDNRGYTSTSSVTNIKMNFSDGTTGKYVHWDFNSSVNNVFDYWTLKNAEWKTRTGWHGTPCLENFSAFANNFGASPGVYLKAGQTYKLEFTGSCSGTKIAKIYINPLQTLGGTLVDTVKLLSTDNFNRIIKKTITVAQSGTYHLILQYPTVESFIQLKFDNIRIIGDLDIPPVALMTAPNKSVIVAQNAVMKLRSNPVSPENKTITKVEYYANNLKLGESSTAPFEFAWQNLPIGSYQVSARPFDVDGRSALSTPVDVTVQPNQFSSASYLGSIKKDDIRAGIIQKNGTIVLAANLGLTPSQTSLKLNGAVDSTQGCIVRVASDGKSILSITRFTDLVLDMAKDSSDNLYIAAGPGGYFKFNAMADAIVWQKIVSKAVHRVDAGKHGNNIILTSNATNYEENTITDVTCFIYDKNGTQLGTMGGASQYTADVAIDDASQTAIVIGFKNFYTGGPTEQQLPVYVPVVRGFTYACVLKYVGYDWGSDYTQVNWLNRATNNMADVRTSRCSIGQDGLLYITFEVYGGNHILRYSPFDNMTTVNIVAGDNYFNFSNTGTETKTFVGRYEPGTGTYLLGQQFTARLERAPYAGNTIFARNGNVTADETGRVYLTGKSASGLPQTIDYQPGEYTGGAYVLVLSPNMATRETCIRLTDGEGRFVAVQDQNRWIYGGNTSGLLYKTNPVFETQNLLADGFWATIDKSPCANNHYLGKNYQAVFPKYESSGTIISNHKLNAGQALVYDSAKSIELKPGFQVNAGTIFKAQIDGCGGN
jgi:Bacterial Ig domain/Carbohydrate binding domain